MGGEKQTITRIRDANEGSPPRRRGKGHGCHQTAVVVGITPAWAGKRCRWTLAPCSGWDHPRVGGEKELDDRFKTAELGSPPRWRGKVSAGSSAALSFRITPAWAGKRRPQQRHRMALQDHPRVGGEKIWAARLAVASRGSPPRGRGKVDAGIAEIEIVGITPAWAGKRLRW